MKGTITENTDKKGSRYRLRFGNIHRRSNNREELERLLNYLRVETDKGTYDPRDYSKEQPLSFTNLSVKYLEIKKKKVKCFTNISNHIGYGQAYFRDTNIKSIGYAELEDFLLQLSEHLSDKSKANILGTLHAFWVWVARRERRDKRSFDVPEFPEVSFELGWRKTISKEDQAAVIEEVKRLTWDINPKIWFGILCLATYPNVRPIELLHVKEEDIDLANGLILVKYNKVPQKYEKMYLLDEDIEFIKTCVRGLPHVYFFQHVKRRGVHKTVTRFGQNYLYRWWKKACKNLGIEGVDLYGGTRHSTVIALGEQYTPEEIMGLGTGHTTNKAFKRYFQVQADKKKTIYRSARRGKVVQFQGGPKVANSETAGKGGKYLK